MLVLTTQYNPSSTYCLFWPRQFVVFLRNLRRMPKEYLENTSRQHPFKLRMIVFPPHYVSSSTKISSLNDLRLIATDHANPQVPQCISTEIVPPTQLLYLSGFTTILRTHLESADLSVPCLKPNFELFPILGKYCTMP